MILEKGKVYWRDPKYIFRFGGGSLYISRISLESEVFCTHGSFSYDTIPYLPTTKELQWFEQCEKENRFIEFKKSKYKIY